MSNKFVRTFLIVSGLTGFSRISGVVREIILANIFGASAFTDIYAFATKLPNFFRRFFAEGALNAVLVPKFSNLIEHDTKKNIQKFANEIFSVFIIGLLLFVIIVEICMPYVVNVMAPGFRNNATMYSNIVYYTRLLFPYILMLSSIAFISGILNAMHCFAWSAAISSIVNISAIFGFFYCKIFKLNSVMVMHVLCFSIIIGGFIQCLILWINCNHNGIRISFVSPVLTPEIKQIFKASIPGMIGAGVVQINILIDMAFATTLPIGSVSYLSYADRLNQLPLSLLGVALSTTIFPTLSRCYGNKNYSEAHSIQLKALLFALMFAIPSAIGLFILAEPIIQMLYGHGKFDQVAVIKTTLALRAFVCGLPCYVVTKIFSTVFFANKDTKTPVITSGICVFVNVTLNILLIARYGHVGIAMVTTISACINTILSGIILQRRKMFIFTKECFYKIFCIVCASIVMGYALLVCDKFICLHKLIKIPILVLIGICCYTFQIYILKIYRDKNA
jgi:putative peptidoglycan lipid II flippase